MTFKRLLKWFTIVATLLGAALFSLPLFISLNDYRPILEEQLSSSLGRQVVIGHLSPQVMPLPALTASNVSILGTPRQPGEVFVERLRAVFDPLELLKGKLVISRIQLDGGGTNLAFIKSLINGAVGNSETRPQTIPLAIHQISGSNIMLRTGNNIRLGPYRFVLQLGEQFAFEEVNISRVDEALHVTIKPNQHNSLDLLISGSAWQLPVGLPLQFDQINAQATLHAGRAELIHLEIDGYNGTLTTHGTLRWHNGWQYSGKLTTADLQMAPLLAHFDINTIDGHFLSKFDISLHGKALSQLFYDPELQGSFQINSGIISKSGNAGELLKFDKLSAHTSLYLGSAKLSDVEISAYNGTLTTEGKLSWLNGWQYNGKLTTTALQMAPLLSGFNIDTIDGLFYSELDINLHNEHAGELFSNPDLKGAFRITDGIVSKTDSVHQLLKFKELSCNGHLKDSMLITNNTVLKTAGGTIHGTTQLSWKEQWDIKGTIEASEIDAETLLSGFIENKVVSGTLYADTKFHLLENDQEGLLDNPYLSGDFRMINGTIYKADLAKASTNFSKSGSHGGETPFQNLVGHTTLENNHITIANLGITSDSLTASGDININPDDELEGEVTVALRSTASIISAPLKVSGTINDPSLRLTNDAIIGGAIGTSMLGPGLGTAVGMKVGRIIKKIGSALSSGQKAKADLIPAP